MVHRNVFPRAVVAQMTPEQLKALQRYISATAYFMLHHTTGNGNVREYLDAKAHLEASFTKVLPGPRDFPDIL